MNAKLALLLGVVACVSGAGAAAAGAATPAAVLFNLTSKPLVQPDRFFFQADAGPYMKDLAWTGWGEATATGSGRYIRDCAVGPCGAPGENHQNHPATLTVSDPGPCPRLGSKTQVYRHGRVDIDRDGAIETTELDLGDAECATRPSRRAAERALTAHVKRTLHVTPTSVACRNPDVSDWECVARFTRRGKAVSRRYFVSGTISGRVRVTSPY